MTTTRTRKSATKRQARKPVETRDVYQDVTDRIIAALETCGEHERPWTTVTNGAGRPRSIDGRPYRGMNTLLLWVSAIDHDYTSGVWGTYRAWQRHDAQVRKGEQGTMVTLWKQFDRKATADEIAAGAADKDGRIKSLVLRHFTVFAAEQVDGWTPPTTSEPTHVDPIDHAEKFFAAVGADVTAVPGLASAYYDPRADAIKIEHRDNFRSAELYYAVLGHEHGHWTGAESRCNRTLKGTFGSPEYAGEELVAELTAAFVGAHLGIESVVRDDHAAYVKNWLRALRNDKKAVFTAASAAQKATDYLLAAAGESPFTDEAGDE